MASAVCRRAKATMTSPYPASRWRWKAGCRSRRWRSHRSPSARKSPLPPSGAQPEEPRTLLEVPALRDEDLFDRVGVIDQPHAEGAQPCLDPVTVLSRARDIEAELVVLEIGGAAEEEPPAGSLERRLHLPSASRADRVSGIANTRTLSGSCPAPSA